MKKEVSYKIVSLVFSVLVICFVIAFYVLGWTEPTAVPPGGNVPAPINVGNTDQWKDGRLGVGTPDGAIYWLADVGNSLYFQSQVTNQTRMVIGADGNVGIGTPTPGAKLEVAINTSGTTVSSGQTINIRQQNTTDNNRSEIVFVNGTGTRTNYFGVQHMDHDTFKGDFIFNGATGSDEWMRITNTGNVGIGTPSPGAKLEVAGQVKITGGTPGAGKVLTSDVNGLSSWQQVSGGGISTKRNTTDCVKVAWDGSETPHWCPPNYVLAGAEPNGSDSYEWHWFWCCPLGE